MLWADWVARRKGPLARKASVAASRRPGSQPALSQIVLHTELSSAFACSSASKGASCPHRRRRSCFSEADRLFHDLENVRRLALDLRHGKVGTVRLAASAPPSLSFVPLSRGASWRANIVLCGPGRTIAAMLDRGQAGLGIAMTDQPLPAIDTELLARTRIVCVVPAAHRLARRRAVSLRDLEGETIISYRGASLPGMLLERALSREGLRLHPLSSSKGLGVALVDGLIPWGSFPGIVSRPFPADSPGVLVWQGRLSTLLHLERIPFQSATPAGSSWLTERCLARSSA